MCAEVRCHRVALTCACPCCVLQFKIALEELRAGAELKTVSPNIHINALFRADEKSAPVVVELQLYHLAILAMKLESHRLYDWTRATSIYDLLR